jgi:hypothetical protein
VKSVPTNNTGPQAEPSGAFGSSGRRALFAIFFILCLSSPALESLQLLGSPLLRILLVASTVSPWLDAWRAASGTALRPALVWAALALLLLLGACTAALAEPVGSGRPMAGRLTYVAVLCFLAAFVSVLNARAPANRVWAGLAALLVVVFLIPWLEAPGRLRQAQGLGQLHLDAPWTLFYAILVLVCVTNYLPTRFALGSLGFGLGFVLEYQGLTQLNWPPERRAILWSWVSWTFALSVWLARWRAHRGATPQAPFERLWFWFRDAWGVVWALRTQERFNRSAGLRGWPVRLSWFGLIAASGLPESRPLDVPIEAIADFRGMIRRFAQPEKLEHVLRGP